MLASIYWPPFCYFTLTLAFFILLNQYKMFASGKKFLNMLHMMFEDVIFLFVYFVRTEISQIFMKQVISQRVSKDSLKV